MSSRPALSVALIIAAVHVVLGGGVLHLGGLLPRAWPLLLVGTLALFALTALIVGRLHVVRARVSRVVSQSVVPMALTARDSGRILEANEALAQGLGSKLSEIVGRTTVEVGLWPDPERRAGFLEDLAKGRTIVETDVRRRDGERLRVLCATVPLDIDGHPCLLTQIADLTPERRREERQRLALEGSQEALWDWRPGQRQLHVDERAYALLGFKPEDFPGDEPGWVALCHPEDRARVGAQLVRQMGVGAGHLRVEPRLRRKSGEYGVFLVRGKVMERDPEGRAVRVAGTLVDISQRARAENELLGSYRRVTDILESTSDGFLSLDPALVIRSFNSAAERLLGRAREEVIGRTLTEAFPELVSSPFEERFREALARRSPLSFETHIAVKPYENWYDVRVFPIREGLSVFFRVTTERRRLEEQLRRAQKMEAIGRLAGGVAHDFNNQLAAILGYDELLLRELPEGHPARPRAELIRKAAERAATLTRQLLAFGRRQVLEPQLLNLNGVVGDVSELLHRTIGEDIALVTRLAPDLGLARLDRAQLEQALLSLVVNARDAMPRGGQLTLETRNATLDAAYCARHLDAHPGPHVLLSVTDTGGGMDAATLGRLFEPFFTTKEFGKGTGLGLATVYGVVTQSGGHIAVESTVGQGSRFLVYLPRVESGARSSGPAATPAAVATPAVSVGGETILVVEDEAVVRRLIVEVLRASGYCVLEADDGAEGERVAETHLGPIHLLVTDVVMPSLGGQDLADMLRGARAELRVLFMSGHAEDAFSAERPVAPAQLLAKPFTPTTLVKRVREALAAPPTSKA